MRKLGALGLMILALAILILSLSWRGGNPAAAGLSPSEKQQLETIKAGVQKRAVEARSLPPGQNAYVVLLPLLSQRSNSADCVAVRGLAGFYNLDRLQLMRSLESQRFKAGLAAFQKVAPRLELAAQRPELRYPRELSQGLELAPFNYSLLRDMSRALLVRAISRAQGGDPSGALEDFLRARRLALLLNQAGGLVDCATALDMMAPARGEIQLMMVEGRLSPADLEVASRGLSSGLLPETFLQAADLQMVRTVISLERAGQGKPSARLGLPPGRARQADWLARQQIGCQRLYLKYRPAFERLVAPRSLGLDLQSDLRQLAATGDYVPSFLSPDAFELALRYRLALDQQDAARAMAALELYRCAHGDYPAGLDRLQGQDPFSPRLGYQRTGPGRCLVEVQSPDYAGMSQLKRWELQRATTR